MLRVLQQIALPSCATFTVDTDIGAPLTHRLLIELRVARALLFVMKSKRCFVARALFDSPACACETGELCRWKERWRFWEMVLPVPKRALSSRAQRGSARSRA